MNWDWQTILISIIPAVLGISFIWGKVDKILKALKECSDVLTSIVVSFDDKELSKEELQQIKKKGIEAIAAIKAIFK